MRISPFFLRRVPLKTGVKNFCRLWRVVWAGAKRPSQIVTTDIEMGGGDNIASAHFAKCTVVLNRTLEPLERLAVVVKPRRIPFHHRAVRRAVPAASCAIPVRSAEIRATVQLG